MAEAFAVENQRKMEEEYYRNVVVISGEILFVDSLQEARSMVVANRGVLLVDNGSDAIDQKSFYCRIPLCSSGRRISGKYGVYWKKDNSEQ